MRTLFQILCLLSVATVASCDLRSGIARQNAEKYISTPAPPVSPTPTPAPIDPADIVEVDISQDGDLISINGYGLKQTVKCIKFNRLMVNGNTNLITIKGGCRQIMLNGDKNEIAADASMEVVFNGTENIVKYSRFPNGKRPVVIENQAGNITEKIEVLGKGGTHR